MTTSSPTAAGRGRTSAGAGSWTWCWGKRDSWGTAPRASTGVRNDGEAVAAGRRTRGPPQAPRRGGVPAEAPPVRRGGLPHLGPVVVAAGGPVRARRRGTVRRRGRDRGPAGRGLGPGGPG